MAKKKENKETSKEVEKMEVPKQPTQLEYMWLKGPVKKIMQTTYQAYQRDGQIIQGKVILDNSYHGLNFIRIFDETGTYIKTKDFGPTMYHFKTYDAKGRAVDEINYMRGKFYSKNVHVYNKWERLSEIIVTDITGKLMYRTFDTYDEEGKKLDHKHFNGVEETVVAYSVNTYNEMGKQISDIEYDMVKNDGSIKRQILHKYDERGNCLGYSIEYLDDMKPHSSSMAHVFNEHNDIIETTMYDADGNVKHTSTQTYEYDENGKKIVPYHPPYIHQPDELEEGETEEVTEDSHGNWTKKTKFINKLPVSIMYREIRYYDDTSTDYPEFEHVILSLPVEEMVEKKEMREEDFLKVEDAKWLVDGPQTTAENFQQLRYYGVTFREAPSVYTIHGPYIEPFALYEELTDNLRAEEIHSYSTVSRGYRPRMARYTLSFPSHPGYILTASGFGGQNIHDFILPPTVKKHAHDYVYTSQIQLLRPSSVSGRQDEYFEEDLLRYIEFCSYTKKPDQPTINMIEVNNQGFTMVEHDVDDSFEIRDLDVNYGYGFAQFHKELMGRFNNGTKGLVLFHGLPGTGKTYYIRHLLREMANSKKEVIYMPPNMVDHLTDPAFMTFLSGEVRDWSSDGKFCVLLIEDAEPLLAKRQEGVRIQGVTNLLNMTDGLLNDMLNLQIICTFNVDLKKLDSALLRPGRLIARKEFKALNELDANLLAQRLGIKHHFKKSATLGEIYSFGKNMSTLIHDVEADRDASTEIDDL